MLLFELYGRTSKTVLDISLNQLTHPPFRHPFGPADGIFDRFGRGPAVANYGDSIDP
jgi:hypothetical protein